MNRLFVPALIFLFSASALLFGQEAEAAVSEPLSLWGMIKQGGWAMYPLGLCSLSMFFLILHCWRETREIKFVPKGGVDPTRQSLASGNLEEGLRLLAQIPTVLGRVLNQSLSRVQLPLSERKREKVEASLVENLEAEENGISQWINYLNVIAAVAPMIGLLGTVSGMIGAFQQISQSGMGQPDKFAGNIGEALITTATGLVIGIPSMVCFFVMRNRLNNGMLAAVQGVNRVMDVLEETEGGNSSGS